MDSEIIVGNLMPDQWRDYRDIWLEALKEAPEAFSASYEEQRKVSDSIWKERFETVYFEKEGVVVFARIGNKPVGFVGAYFETNEKFRHVATIWGAYVQPDYRKQGIARDMANELLRKLILIPHLKKVKTYAITNGHLAVNVYQHYGFEIIGVFKDELFTNGKYYDVYCMEKFLQLPYTKV